MRNVQIQQITQDIKRRVAVYRAEQKHRSAPFQMNGTRKSILKQVDNGIEGLLSEIFEVDSVIALMKEQKNRIQAKGLFGKESVVYGILTDAICALSSHAFQCKIDQLRSELVAARQENESQRCVIEAVRRGTEREVRHHYSDVRTLGSNNERLWRGISELTEENKDQVQQLKTLEQERYYFYRI